MCSSLAVGVGYVVFADFVEVRHHSRMSGLMDEQLLSRIEKFYVAWHLHASMQEQAHVFPDTSQGISPIASQLICIPRRTASDLMQIFARIHHDSFLVVAPFVCWRSEVVLRSDARCST